MEIIPRSSVIGAEVCGLDLSVGLDQAAFDQLSQAFLDHQALFFRDQQLTARQYNGFAERFGSLKDYLFAAGMDGFPYITEIVRTETGTESFGSFWHSDSAYTERPPKITMLYARQVAPRDETGRHAVYVKGIHTLSFEGLTRAESLPMLEYLYRQADTLAMWDNRCTQHYALNDYHGCRRVIHRIIVEGPLAQ